MREIAAFVMMAQVLGVAAILGTSLRDLRSYRTPFGKLFLPFKTQVIVLIWLLASLFLNVCLIAIV